MRRHLAAYFPALAAFLVLDGLWLGFLAGPWYREQLGELLLPRPNIGAAAFFYALYVVGVVIFAVRPADSGRKAAALGALFGFFAYATYDMTNLATLKGWPASVAIVDMAWGAFVTACAAIAGYAAARRFGR